MVSVSRVVVETTAASSGGRVLELLCVEWNGMGSNLAVHFDFFPYQIFF